MDACTPQDLESEAAVQAEGGRVGFEDKQSNVPIGGVCFLQKGKEQFRSDPFASVLRQQGDVEYIDLLRCAVHIKSANHPVTVQYGEKIGVRKPTRVIRMLGVKLVVQERILLLKREVREGKFLFACARVHSKQGGTITGPDISQADLFHRHACAHSAEGSCAIR
jgi:hypothetical protein